MEDRDEEVQAKEGTANEKPTRPKATHKLCATTTDTGFFFFLGDIELEGIFKYVPLHY